jgi:hypothetical protein
LGVGASWSPLTTFISETMIVRSTLLTNAGRKFHKESKEKKPIKIRLEIKSQNYGCLWLLALSNLGNGKSYNSVAIFQTLILVVDPILETIRVIKKLLEN